MNLMTTYFLPLLKGNIISMASEDIKYIRSDGPIVYIIDICDQQLAGGQSLKFYKDVLEENSFFQISQSTIVNLAKVRYIDAVSHEVELTCGKRIAMSRNGLKSLKEFIKSKGYKW